MVILYHLNYKIHSIQAFQHSLTTAISFLLIQTLFFFYFSKYVPRSVRPLIQRVSADIDNYLPQPFADELRGYDHHFLRIYIKLH